MELIVCPRLLVENYFVKLYVEGSKFLVATFYQDKGLQKVLDGHQEALALYEQDLAAYQEAMKQVEAARSGGPEPARIPHEPTKPEDLVHWLVPMSVERSNELIGSWAGWMSIDKDSVYPGESVGTTPGTYWRLAEFDYIDWPGHGAGNGEAKGCALWDISVDTKGFVFAPVNRWFESSLTKDRTANHFRRRDRSALFNLLVPYGATTLDQVTPILYFNPDVGFSTNFDGRIVAFKDANQVNKVVDAGTAKVLISGPGFVKSGEAIDIEVMATNLADGVTQCEVLVEALAGYVSRTRIACNPTGKFTFRALDLAAGEQARLKFGTHNRTGLTDFFINIV